MTRPARSLLHACLLTLAVSACTPSATGLARDSAATAIPGGGISADNLARHLSVLASDAFEGRAPTTEGERRTVAYISGEFAKAGLQPAGDDGGWTQAVTLERSTIVGPVRAQLHVGGASRALANGDDIAVETLHPDGSVDLRGAELVFAGYGITAPELDWDDYAGLDVAGKVVVVLINDPDFETAPGRFGGRALTWYGRWTYKYEEAARRGAAGVLIVHETAPAAYPWATVRNGRAGPQYDIVRADAGRHHLPMRGWMQRHVAEQLFRDAGRDFEAEKTRAQQAGFRGEVIDGATLDVAFAVERDRITTHNVLGVLPGASRPDETVILSGHWDSFGIGTAGEDGDAIINGAVDNATAVASLIELARVFAAGERPARSLLFIALTAEENGLLGATYYAANPLRPLETTAGVLNMEMWSPDGETRDISSWGVGRVSLERDLVAAAAVDGRTYSPDPNLEAGFFYRADHFAFAQAGVPAITIGPGMDQLDGGVEGGRAARADYFAHRYHQPGDAFDASWDMAGPTADTRTVYRLAAALADGDGWPRWDDDSEFHARRAASDAVRGAD
ncbi:M28 family metallopeptidase [Luteimonas sp. BDR2-5]|uniref:M28 family metallopeptidase n=1 Tax=Proluteimonas luteida TaxID=2878685 RepID=UPI001E4EA857|nr:M28 family metallopeptidase [Luteimonas sp. BDR2-5]MCD9027778.1 M28 family metallopeptidase [Luteimonas sp. BDR2-5]